MTTIQSDVPSKIQNHFIVEPQPLRSAPTPPDRQTQVRFCDLAYDELRRVAAEMMRSERSGHTLQPTALVHEAAARVFADKRWTEKDRSYLFAAMAQAMRRILIDHARQRGAQRRGGGMQRTPWDDALAALQQQMGSDVELLDDALQVLETQAPRAFQVVVLRFFGGLELSEIAEQLAISGSTVDREWRFARAWLRTQLGGQRP